LEGTASTNNYTQKDFLNFQNLLKRSKKIHKYLGGWGLKPSKDGLGYWVMKTNRKYHALNIEELSYSKALLLKNGFHPKNFTWGSSSMGLPICQETDQNFNKRAMMALKLLTCI
jgi:hypothetical protein